MLSNRHNEICTYSLRAKNLYRKNFVSLQDKSMATVTAYYLLTDFSSASNTSFLNYHGENASGPCGLVNTGFCCDNRAAPSCQSTDPSAYQTNSGYCHCLIGKTSYKCTLGDPQGQRWCNQILPSVVAIGSYTPSSSNGTLSFDMAANSIYVNSSTRVWDTLTSGATGNSYNSAEFNFNAPPNGLIFQVVYPTSLFTVAANIQKFYQLYVSNPSAYAIANQAAAYVANLQIYYDIASTFCFQPEPNPEQNCNPLLQSYDFLSQSPTSVQCSYLNSTNPVINGVTSPINCNALFSPAGPLYGSQDTLYQTYCTNNPTSLDCQCYNRSSNPAYTFMKEALDQSVTQVSSTATSTSPFGEDSCWYAPCQQPFVFTPWSIQAPTNCPNVCCTIIDVLDRQGPENISQNNVTFNCPSNFTTCATVITENPSVAPCSAPVVTSTQAGLDIVNNPSLPPSNRPVSKPPVSCPAPIDLKSFLPVQTTTTEQTAPPSRSTISPRILLYGGIGLGAMVLLIVIGVSVGMRRKRPSPPVG